MMNMIYQEPIKWHETSSSPLNSTEDLPDTDESVVDDFCHVSHPQHH